MLKNQYSRCCSFFDQGSGGLSCILLSEEGRKEGRNGWLVDMVHMKVKKKVLGALAWTCEAASLYMLHCMRL